MNEFRFSYFHFLLLLIIIITTFTTTTTTISNTIDMLIQKEMVEMNVRIQDANL